MKRILITGMSGTGKSTVIEELAARGYPAVDLDSSAYSEWVAVPAHSDIPGTPVEPGRDWVWQEARVEQLLAPDGPGVLFVSGCASNMKKFRARFDQVILLSAPDETLLQRLASRTNNAYGKRSEVAARVLDLVRSVEPLLRKSADHEINTHIPLKQVVHRVLELAGLQSGY